MNEHERWRGWKSIFGLIVLVALLGCSTARVRAADHRTDTHESAASAASTQANKAFEQRLRKFLQHRFLISDPNNVQFGPVEKSPIEGISIVHVTLTNDRGQSVGAEVFTDSGRKWAILGQMFNVEQSAWKRVDMSSITLAGRPVLGPSKAPVTIVEFGDFECPYCAHAFMELETMIHTTYKGKIRLIFKNFPLSQHPWAMRAALAAECAKLQNPQAFWKFARDFYTQQSTIGPDNIDTYINQKASGMGLDTGLLDTCMKSSSASQYVARDIEDGHMMGVASTPTFLVNGIKMVGLPDKKAFRYLINQEIELAHKHDHSAHR